MYVLIRKERIPRVGKIYSKLLKPIYLVIDAFGVGWF
jgi:hypothetical protein